MYELRVDFQVLLHYTCYHLSRTIGRSGGLLWSGLWFSHEFGVDGKIVGAMLGSEVGEHVAPMLQAETSLIVEGHAQNR